MKNASIIALLAATAVAAGACGTSDAAEVDPPGTRPDSGTVVVATDTVVQSSFDAPGTAEAFAEATLSTKVMGAVTGVLVREGDRVAAGQPLVQIDARDLVAKQSQASAGIAAAEAMLRDAQVQAARMRALYADSAATRAQLDAAETGLARADAAVRQAHAGASELTAVAGYSVVRAPFAGVVTRRFVDVGAFAAPGAPLVTVQDDRRLRVTATVTPDAARSLRRGTLLQASVEDRRVPARIEGVVPAPAGNAYTVNAIVENGTGALLAGSAASLAIPMGTRPAVIVPAAAIRSQGDLRGVVVRTARGTELRWVRVGASLDDRVEILSGVRSGEAVVLGGTPARAATGGER